MLGLGGGGDQGLTLLYLRENWLVLLAAVVFDVLSKKRSTKA